MTDFCTHFVTHFVATVFKIEQWSTPGLVDNCLVNGANMFKISKSDFITKLWRHQVTTFLKQFFNKGNFFSNRHFSLKEAFSSNFYQFSRPTCLPAEQISPCSKNSALSDAELEKTLQPLCRAIRTCKDVRFFAREKSNFTKSVTHFVATVFKIEHWATPGFVDNYLVHGANMLKFSENDIINVLWRHDVTSL